MNQKLGSVVGVSLSKNLGFSSYYWQGECWLNTNRIMKIGWSKGSCVPDDLSCTDDLQETQLFVRCHTLLPVESFISPKNKKKGNLKIHKPGHFFY